MLQQVKAFLDEFAKGVKEKKYKKINYNLWRALVKEEHKLASVEVEVSLSIYEGSCVEVKFSIDNGRDYVFEADDESFGQFLLDWHQRQVMVDLSIATKKLQDSFSTLATTAKTATITFDDTTKSISDLAIYTKEPDWATSSCSTNNAYTVGIEVATPDNFRIAGQTITQVVEDIIKNHENRKENDNMDLFKGFDFGSCENDSVKMSMYGIAVKNATGTWVSYDSKSGNVMDVDILNFNGKYLYKMPVATKDIAKGDTIIHNRKPMFVTDISDGKILVIDPAAGEEKIILPTKNMFGFDFVTRIINPFGSMINTASADQPFGNMLPLMMLADGGNANDMLPLMFLMGGDGNFDMSNPMMMYMLMKDGKHSDMLPLYFLMNGQKCHYKQG